MPEHEHVLYRTDGKGRWWRTEWEPQCKASVVLARECQGAKGHKDVHWCFGPDGSFHWSDNEDDPREDGCSGMTPPDHKTYRTPKSMQKHYYVSHRTTKEVVDPSIVAMLEKDKTPEKSASVDRPVTDPALIEKLRRRMKQKREPRDA